MRNFIAAFLLISAAGSSVVCAQNTPPVPPSPAAIAQRRVNFLTTRLGLNSTQQSQALGFFTTAATTDATLQADLRTARQSLKTAIESNNLTNISTLTLQIGTLTGQVALADATAQAAFYAILTTAQQTTFSQERGMGGPGPEGPGFGGGPRFRGRP